MKALSRKALLIFAFLAMPLLLAACATQAPPKSSAGQVSLTDQYMYQIERNAQSRMVTVFWINPPKSESLSKADDDDS